jgi:pimeloyl-ACP methyl ester carboxylesterase
MTATIWFAPAIMRRTVRLLVTALCISLVIALMAVDLFAQEPPGAAAPEHLALFDSARGRAVPVALYAPRSGQTGIRRTPVLLSHGYGENKGGANLEYSALSGCLAANGYVVASIQHELPTDSPLAMTGPFQITRRTNWERGVANILFVLNELQRIRPELDYGHVALVGHSNGGDMTALFARQYPHLANKIVTLDNRRMALPRTSRPQVYSLRSSDQPADSGVLPSAEEQVQHRMTIITLANTIHNDMDDSGNDRQRQEICAYVLDFLK